MKCLTLLRHLIQKHKRELHSGARGKGRELLQSLQLILWETRVNLIPVQPVAAKIYFRLVGWLTDCHCHPERYAAWIAGNVIEALCFLQDCIAYLVACEGNRWMDRELLHSTKTEGYSTYTQYLHIAVNASSICCLYSTYRCAAPPSQPLALSAVSGYGSHHVLLLSISSQGRASIAGNREEAQVRRAVQPLRRSEAIPSSDVPQGSWGDEMEHTVKKTSDCASAALTHTFEAALQFCGL